MTLFDLDALEEAYARYLGAESLAKAFDAVPAMAAAERKACVHLSIHARACGWTPDNPLGPIAWTARRLETWRRVRG